MQEWYSLGNEYVLCRIALIVRHYMCQIVVISFVTLSTRFDLNDESSSYSRMMKWFDHTQRVRNKSATKASIHSIHLTLEQSTVKCNHPIPNSTDSSSIEAHSSSLVLSETAMSSGAGAF